MRTKVRGSGPLLMVGLAIGTAAGGAVSIVAGVLVGFLIADHSSSDSSPSSLISIGLTAIGFLLVVLAAVLFTGGSIWGLWRRARGPRGG